MSVQWKKGRGKLGFLQPVFGRWRAEAESEMGPIQCERTYEKVLGDKYIQLTAKWRIGEAREYEEIALIGIGNAGTVTFWSFTSDGKHSSGTVADVTDVHPRAIGFEAQMEGRLARMIFWPADDGFFWAVEARNAKGWKRFVEHHYRPA